MKKIKILVLALLVVLAAVALVSYLRGIDIAILNPKGHIAYEQRRLIIFCSLLALVVIIPVFTLTFLFAWKYRETNTKAKYSPEWDHSLIAETIWWTVPIILIFILSIVTWNTSHTLDPSKPLNSSVKPITVQVVALDWKWLFIYPEQNLASVNFVQFPKDTPVNFEITSDAPMNSFWIPQLGGQIYAMSGMSTNLHLIADYYGNFRGSSANISGEGFAGMSFIAKSSSLQDFNNWVNRVKQSSNYLSLDAYNNLAKPSKNNPVTYYSSVEPGLYDTIVAKYSTHEHLDNGDGL